MIDNKAFSFGATERSSSWWAEYERTLPERQALEEEKRQLVAQMEREQAERELMKLTGPGLVSILRSYEAQGLPADTEKVAQEFREAFPGASFREVLEILKREGVIHELVSSTQGFMGTRSTRLHLL